MSTKDFLTEAEVAEILHMKPSTLMKNRCVGKNHPPFKKIGRKVLYPRKELDRWISEQPLHTEIKAG